MKSSRAVITAVLAAAFSVVSLGGLPQAQAATTDPISGLTATAVQTPGTHDRWTVTATWTENGASAYSVEVASQATGGVTYAARATEHSPANLTTAALFGGHDFWVRVQPEGGDPVAAQVHVPVLDTTPPTGRYRLDATTRYLGSSLMSDKPEAEFLITQTAMQGAKTRKVLAGDGSPAVAWTSGSTFSLRYTEPGVYTPHVVLSDEFANTTDITLPVVRVSVDQAPPTIRITRPAHQGRVSSWRRIRGTATDVGTGVVMVGAFVMEKRGATWWSYDFHKRTWLEGTSSRKDTEKKSKARPAFMPPTASGAWRTPVIKGLTAGTLFVEAAAFDGEFNVSGKTLTQRIH